MSSGAPPTGNQRLLSRLLWVVLAPLLACGGGAAQTSDGATPPAGDASGLTSCGAACLNYASACGAQPCTIDCSVQYMVFEEAACDREFGDYFRCVAALPKTKIVCDKDFLAFVDAQKCPDPFMALNLCRATKGAACAPEPAFDDSCSVTNKPPHFQFCKVGVQPPIGCVDFGGTTGWFCCP